MLRRQGIVRPESVEIRNIAKGGAIESVDIALPSAFSHALREACAGIHARARQSRSKLATWKEKIRSGRSAEVGTGPRAHSLFLAVILGIDTWSGGACKSRAGLR
jgi:hypothetical protein